MKLGTVSVNGRQRVAVAVNDPGERAVVLYPGPTVAGLIKDWPAGRDEDATRNLTHKVPDVVSYLSGYQTLEPGDIIAMGTALAASASGGTAVQNVNLTELGGPIEVTISGIGTLSNPVEMR